MVLQKGFLWLHAKIPYSLMMNCSSERIICPIGSHSQPNPSVNVCLINNKLNDIDIHHILSNLTSLSSYKNVYFLLYTVGSKIILPLDPMVNKSCNTECCSNKMHQILLPRVHTCIVVLHNRFPLSCKHLDNVIFATI